MRWVFASLLAGLVTVVLFFGMMRFVEDREEEAYEAVKPTFQTHFVLSTLPQPWRVIGCGGRADRFPIALPKPEISQKARLLDQAQVALLNASRPVRFEPVSLDMPAFMQSRPGLYKSTSACIVHHSPCDRHPTPEVQYPRTGTTARLPDTNCDVSFVVGVDGRPQDIEVACGHPAFESVSREAISQMQYVTEDRCGPCERGDKRITYPLRFRYE